MINKDEINFDGFDFKLKMLFWKTCTASEKNNDFFTLERSKDGTSFEKLKTVSGAGNSDHVLNYSEKRLELNFSKDVAADKLHTLFTSGVRSQVDRATEKLTIAPFEVFIAEVK